MHHLKYIIEVLLILLIFSVSSAQAENLTVYCNKPSYFKWGENNTKWESQKNPVYRNIVLQINFDLLRSRVKYQDKWYSWSFATFENDIITWDYSQKFSYEYNISKKQLIEKQDELFLKYTSCRSIS